MIKYLRYLLVVIFMLSVSHAKVIDGERANAARFNSSFMDREIDTDTVGIIDLLNTAPASGPTILNLQAAVNSNSLGLFATETINIGGTISITTTFLIQRRPVVGSGAVTVSTTPFGTGTFNNATLIRLIGTDNSNTVTITNNDIVKGALLRGATFTLKLGDYLDLEYDLPRDRWVEVNRSKSTNTANLQIVSNQEIQLIPNTKVIIAANIEIQNQKGLILQDLTGGEGITIKAPGTLPGNYVLELPTTDGNPDELIVSDGSGVLSFIKIANINLDASAAIARSKIANGTANYVVINDGSGGLSEEEFLAKIRGGAGADMSSVTFPTSGILATDTNTLQLTNKDIDGGTAANDRRITLPQDTTSNLNGLTRKKATLWYDTTTDTLKLDDGTNLNEISGGGGGTGGINALSDPSFETDVSNVTVGTDNAKTQEATIFYHPISGGKSLKIVTTTAVIDAKQISTFTEWANTSVEVSCFIKSTSSVVRLCSSDDSTDILCVDYDGTNIWKKVVTSMIVPADGKMGWHLISDASTSATIYVDECVVSELRPNIIIDEPKQYSEADGDFTVTDSTVGTVWTTQRAVAIPYKTANEVWRLRFNIRGTVDVAVDLIIIELSGVIWKPGISQAAACWQTTSAANPADMCVTQGTGGIKMLITTTASHYSFSGDLELESKPTWADDIVTSQSLTGDAFRATQIKWINVSGCNPDTTAGSFANMNDAQCTFASSLRIGTSVAPGTSGDIVLKIPSLGPGRYKVFFNGQMRSSNATDTTCGFRIYDGTNSIAEAVAFSNSTNFEYVNGMQGYVEYTSQQTNLELAIQGKRTSGTGACALQAIGDFATMAIGIEVDSQFTFSPLNPIKWQMKTLTGSVSTTGVIAAPFQFTNLEIGKTYRISLTPSVGSSSTSQTDKRLRINILNNAVALTQYRHRAGSNVHPTQFYETGSTVSAIFVAAGTTVTFDVALIGSDLSIETDSHATLEELSNHTEVSQW